MVEGKLREVGEIIQVRSIGIPHEVLGENKESEDYKFKKQLKAYKIIKEKIEKEKIEKEEAEAEADKDKDKNKDKDKDKEE